MWRPGRGHFLPQGYNLNKLGIGPLGDATYQISKLLALRFQRIRFLKFSSWKSIFSLCDLDMQMDRNHLNNFKRGSYKDHSYQVWSKSSQ